MPVLIFHFPNIIGIKQFLEIVIRLAGFHLFDLLLHGLIIRRSLDIANHTQGNREIRKAAECRTEEDLARFVKTLSGPNALSGLLSGRDHHVTGCYYLKVLGIAQLKYWIATLEGKKAPELPAHLTIRNGIVHDEITGLYFKLYFKERTR